MNITFSLIGLLALASPALADGAKAPFNVGLASKAITPAEPVWMGGYANRNKPAQEKEHDLWLKVLALEDASGGKLVLLTSDLLGLPRHLSQKVAAEVQRRTGLPRERLLLTSSHTHCGPVLNGILSNMYPLTPAQAKSVDVYTERLGGWMVETIVAAMADLKPARLAAGKGTARFAVNRRKITPEGVVGGANPDGPVDHDVPVLRLESADGRLRGVVFGYACHNTTLQYYKWCGDYAGFAQAYLQEKHPGALAFFWAGCGGDANPLPRSTVELCQKYGKELANAVDNVLGRAMTPVHGNFAAKYALLALPFDRLPTREQLAAEALSKQLAYRVRAERLLKALDQGGGIEDSYGSYPVQVWRLGDGPLWISLGGEVVVDYSLRLKRELPGNRPVWVTAYANDVMAYIPSARVLKEGGYEGEFSMVYYGLPTKWAPAIEEKIVEKVKLLVNAVAAPGKD